MTAVSTAIGRLEGNGHFGPFAAVLGQGLFVIAQTPDRASLVLPQDRIILFLSGGPLLRSSTLDAYCGYSGVVVALGGAPVELVVGGDMALQFLQITEHPNFLFRVSREDRAAHQGGRRYHQALSGTRCNGAAASNPTPRWCASNRGPPPSPAKIVRHADPRHHPRRRRRGYECRARADRARL